MDAVITVCGSAAEEVCPYWPGTPLRAHWGVDDPAAAAPVNQPAAFAKAYDLLKTRADALFALPITQMSKADLQTALTKIGS